MIGQTIGHYRIEAELGRGGMGVVYRAHDQVLGRSVALKILPEALAGQAERRARVLAEARSASALNHPGITTIYEVGEAGEQVFLVMELVTGRTLRATLATGAVEPHTALRLGTQIAEALEAAHRAGVIHGDIKPENTIVQEDGRVKLLDFGVARQVAAETLTMTRAGRPSSWLQEDQVAGTLAYMSPEALSGQPVDARTDLFSLGVVLYELIAGRRPFPGPTASALIAQVLNDPVPRLVSPVHAVPAELVRILAKLLEKNPEQRYSSAHDLGVDLNRLVRELEFGALPAAVAGKRAVAVLPFKLLTPSPEDEYLSVALADAVINQLSASGELLVRPTSMVQRYARPGVDPLGAGRELSADVAVEGSIQKIGTKLRVHVQAWQVADGISLASRKYDSEMLELFALQDRIAEELAEALGVPATAAPAAAAPEPPTRSNAAYELYLRAAERLSRLNRWDTRTGIEMLEEATRLDAKFADAWGRLAEACVLMGSSLDPDPRWFRKAELALRRALAIDKNNAQAVCAQGRVLWTPAKGFRNAAALRALTRALELNPGCHPARIWQCLVFLHIGLLEDAREGLNIALASHPDDPFSLVFRGQVAQYEGNYEEADQFHRRALAADPTNVWANNFYPTIPLYTNDLKKAEEKIRASAASLPGDAWPVACEALLWAKRGEQRRAGQLIRRALTTKKVLLHTHHMWHTAAATYATLEKPKQAIFWLRKAAKTGLPNYPAFRDDPHFRKLHNQPGFLRLMAETKKEWEGYRREFHRS